MINIGITCELSKSIWTGSLKQSAVFLYECLERGGFNPVYLSNNRQISDFSKNHKAYNINQILYDKFPNLDIIILHGFTISDEEIEEIKKIHKNCKFVLFYNNHRIHVDQQNLLSGRSFSERINNIDEIWLYGHHSDCAQYIKYYHGTDASVKSVPFLWSPFYINRAKQKLNLEFNKELKPQILVLEPNENSSKTCLIPLLICESFNMSFGNACASFSLFNTDKIKVNKGAKELISTFSAAQQNKVFLNKKWKFIDAISRLGQFILSHNSHNEINNLFLESLHLNLPLIHNSKVIKNYGYYYQDHDIRTASNQIYNAICNHTENLEVYNKENQELIRSLSPIESSNVLFFQKIISHLLK
jgi:hypothetical protein